MRRWALFLPLCFALSCRRDDRGEQPAREAGPVALPAAAPSSAPPAAASASGGAPSAPPEPFVLLFGGDVELGRGMGKRLMKEPDYQPFERIEPWLRAADLRFANLEGPLSDQHGETQSPLNPLVFNGPPLGAGTLARASFDVVSTANNHAFDYGERGVRETLQNLAAAGIVAVGTGASRELAERAASVERKGARVVFFAATDVWNQGASVAARRLVAGADEARLTAAVSAIRKEDEASRSVVVVVSLHAGEEYRDEPLPRTRALAHALVDAGADVVIGHHPHVMQGIERYRGKLVLYSLGNLLMRMHSDHEATGESFLARVRIIAPPSPSPGAIRLELAVCPYRIDGQEPVPLAVGPGADAALSGFVRRLRTRARPFGDVGLGPFAADGCAAALPLATARRERLPRACLAAADQVIP